MAYPPRRSNWIEPDPAERRTVSRHWGRQTHQLGDLVMNAQIADDLADRTSPPTVDDGASPAEEAYP